MLWAWLLLATPLFVMACFGVPAFQLVCLIVTLWFYYGNTVSIKITDPPHSNRYYSSSSSSNKQLTLRAPPANISGPPHLILLSGECFELKEARYTYTVCPFHNVTQEEDSTGWNSFHGVLGVWREWIIEEDRFVGMHFTLGEPCGAEDREVKVMFKCSTITFLTNITEPNRCKYTLWLNTPLACFKGVMQIYHVMNERLIGSWDNINVDYNNGELTKKGLLKKRRDVLLEAGLYYNHTKDKEYFKQQQQQQQNTFMNPVNIGSNSYTTPLLQKELDQCNKRAESFERQLHNASAMMDSVMMIIGKEHPLLKKEIQLYLSRHYHNNSAIKNSSIVLNNTRMANSTVAAIVNQQQEMNSNERMEQVNTIGRTTVQLDSDNDQVVGLLDYNHGPPLAVEQLNNDPLTIPDRQLNSNNNNNNNNEPHRDNNGWPPNNYDDGDNDNVELLADKTRQLLMDNERQDTDYDNVI